jgi:hypothetical protein
MCNQKGYLFVVRGVREACEIVRELTGCDTRQARMLVRGWETAGVSFTERLIEMALEDDACDSE